MTPCPIYKYFPCAKIKNVVKWSPNSKSAKRTSINTDFIEGKSGKVNKAIIKKIGKERGNSYRNNEEISR